VYREKEECDSRYLWMMLLCVQLAGLVRIEVAEEVGKRRHPKQTAATGNAHPCTHHHDTQIATQDIINPAIRRAVIRYRQTNDAFPSCTVAQVLGAIKPSRSSQSRKPSSTIFSHAA
jgi:hypothetical protein